MKMNPAVLLVLLLAGGGALALFLSLQTEPASRGSTPSETKAVIQAGREQQPPASSAVMVESPADAVPLPTEPQAVATPSMPVPPAFAQREEPLPASVPTSGPTMPLTDAFTPQGKGRPVSSNVEELQRQILLLEGQIEYLQGQNDALKDENAQLLQKLGTLGMKESDLAKAQSQNAQMKNDDGVAPDFVGMGLEMMKLRKLQALPMTTVAVSQEELEVVILAWLKRQQPGDEAQRFTRGLAALGWIPESIDPLPLRAALLARVLGGWYDEESETMLTIDPDSASGPSVTANEPLGIAFGQLLREFGGTLFQPQHGRMSLDMRLARESLIAGDAALTRFLHSVQYPAPGRKDDLPAEDPDHPYNQVPLPVFLKELTLFPFSRGFEFAQSLHSTGNFAQVDAAYSRPPISTAEVIEPEIYLDPDRAAPVEIKLGDVKLAGVPPFLDDRLGKFACVTALRRYNRDEDAALGARGLVADRLLAWPAGPDAKRDHAAWQALFMDKESADAFYKAMSKCLSERYKTQGDGEFNADGRSIALLHNHGGAGVLLIDAGSNEVRSAVKLMMQ